MYKIIYSIILCLCMLFLTSCASTSGIVPTGRDSYMIEGTSLRPGVSGAAVMADLYKKAYRYCTKQNKVLVPISEDSENWRAFRGLANAELRFRCLDEDNPELERIKNK